MPIYEFGCRDCRRKTTAIVLSRDRIGEVRCKSCGSANLQRLVSRFATIKSEEARLDSMADPSALGDMDESDPASVARWMKRMGREMGEDFGDDIDQAVEEELAGGSADGHDHHQETGDEGGAGDDTSDQ
jgi:putative FmdB family regulatory protein